jgi:hypothetical protein
MPVVQLSTETYERLQRHAKPFVDSPEDIVKMALDALDEKIERPRTAVSGDALKGPRDEQPAAASEEVNRRGIVDRILSEKAPAGSDDNQGRWEEKYGRRTDQVATLRRSGDT